MPELPEVETVARGLRDTLVGRTFKSVGVRWARTVAAPALEAFAARLTGRRVVDVGRRGKWLFIALDDGEYLLVHLRMSGRLQVEAAGAAEDPHLRVLFRLDDGRQLRFSDQRKFGRMVLVADPAQVVGDLGPEPLEPDFTPEWLAEALGRRRGRLKPLLLDQRFVAGLGNIYTDEALWRARLHPLRLAHTLDEDEARRLHQAIRGVLEEAIANQGTTLEDAGYVGVNGMPGEFAARLAVYGRVGEPCPRCGVPVEKMTVGQRGTSFCPRCQPRA
ncbi:MAG: bifunctional DNA-formamidopyrimidine glycosylase/DNA-(apurinic or apyrimidinic site) lyase [Anaerolineae bacterium]|nr:bifunctional DNA-formamidopyrimidine glycosylase/DNA-(apurinic or apyrimidinic site) lyase [Anaerolineae bacterium]